MSMMHLLSETLVIEKVEKTKGGQEKTRSFKADLLGYIVANELWDGGKAQTDVIRPVFMMYTATESEARYVTANLRSGYKAQIQDVNGGYRSSGSKLEILRSAGYKYVAQTVVADEVRYTVMTVYLPGIFQFDPGMIDPNMAQFICLTPRWWYDRELAKLKGNPKLCAEILDHARTIRLSFGSNAYPTDDEILSYVPLAAYFTAYMEKRTACPMLEGLDFQLQLFFSALNRGVASLSVSGETGYSARYIRARHDGWDFARHSNIGMVERGLQANFHPAVACMVEQDALEQFIAHEVQTYFRAKEYQQNAQAVTVKRRKVG